ncbi:MAG: hypothetical protein H0W78_08645 [Planctomycetes bacterium]|jgi:hypothetical protein|nr:hypothetical protein [Planctomycetota bacterium]
MIEVSQIAAYLRLKREIAAQVAEPDSGFEASRRHLSEGLARSMPIAGEDWTYATAKGGYTFTNPRRRFSVFVADAPSANEGFTAAELLGYLRAFTALDELNQLVVDMWLVRAAMRGQVEQVGAGWRLRGMQK